MNKVILMGRITKDPENRMSQSGTSVTSFTLAVDRQYADQNGNRTTDFINCVAFKHTADFIHKYFVKGQLMAVCGALQTRTYEKDGKTNYVTEVIVDSAYFTGDKREKQNNGTTASIDDIPDVTELLDDSDLPF